MTRNEFDAQMQRLKLEYTRKSNNINRRKDEAARDKRMHLMALRTKHDREHRVEMDKLAELMRAKAALFDGDPKRDQLAMEIRIAEKRMSMMRNEYQAECRCVIDDTYTLRTILDDEARALTEWYEEEKAKVFAEFETSESFKDDNLDNPDNTASITNNQ